MADEALRMEAEVRDKFSGPLKALRSQLLDTARTGANHSETLVKGFKGVEGAMQSTARTASSVVNPALATLGVTGLTAGAAIAGISAALNKLTGNLTGLGQLNRDTGIAAKTLQEFGAVAGRFGIEQEAVAQGAKNFAAQMRTFSRSTGDTFNWVIHQGTNAAGRKAFQDFASDLQHTSDEGEKLKKALSFMETIKNPVERGIFARQFFGNDDFQRLADQHLGTVTQMFKQARERLGAYDPADIINAEKFDRSISSLRSSMQRFGLTVARELLGPATEFTTWMDTLVSGERADVTRALREGLQGVKKELGEINFKQFGEDAVRGLQAGTALAGSMARTFHEIANAIHAIREGDVAGAARGIDGASGPLARRLAPRVGDDEIAAKEQIESWKKALAEAEYDQETGGPAIDFKSREPLLRKRLKESEDVLSGLQGRTPEQRQKDFESSDKLRRSVDALTDEMKASRSGATVQKQSMDTQGGLFGEATVQTAAYGGGGFDRRGRRLPPIDPVQRDARRRAAEGNSGNPDAGWFGGRAGADAKTYGFEQGGRPRLAPIGPRPDVPSIGPSGTGRGARAERGGGSARTGDMMRYAMDQLRQEGVPEDRLREAAAHLVGQATMESGLDPNKVHDGGTGYGIYGARDPKGWGSYRGARRSDMVRWLEANGFSRNSAEGQMREMAHRAMSGAYPRTRGILLGRGTGDLDRDTNTITGEFEAPKVINRRSGAVLNALRTGPSQAKAERAPGVDLPRMPFTRRAEVLADPNDERRQGEKPFYSDEDDRRAARDLGIALRATRAKQEAQREQMRLDGARVGAAAAQAGVVGAQVNGSVTTVIEKAGPEAKAKTSVNGNLFQEVRTQNGSQMRKAD
ncbi:hypothetical protein [Methylobacterium pseudosasicola]|uniref:Phage tail lysozyme domain-containing protein n=1 Tax=Methylobacterium pseudosasicola TaxID=582667 RepID=A0A1I4HKQ7_9HYPH|nr:hypothetical protein [Methylobacterium pseudosasicola]SFL42340.1 hypothetical protein SAMN05192568_1004279 [Methylobacterium pseudosasicola]